MSGNNRKQQNAQREARRLKVLQLTVAGGSSRAVAEQLSKEGYGTVSHTTVQKDLRTVLGQLAETTSEQTVQQRALMNERYNRLFLAWWSASLGKPGTVDQPPTFPNGEAAGKILSILKSIRELNGLDVAVAQRLEHTGAGGAALVPKVEVVWHDTDGESAGVGEAAGQTC